MKSLILTLVFSIYAMADYVTLYPGQVSASYQLANGRELVVACGMQQQPNCSQGSENPCINLQVGVGCYNPNNWGGDKRGTCVQEKWDQFYNKPYCRCIPNDR